jgi:hypothetical protein
MRGAFRTVLMNLIPIAVSAAIALLLVSTFYTEHYSVSVSKLDDYTPADDRLVCSVESVVYEGENKDVLVIRGWAADTKLYSGYNYGAEMTVTSTYNETCFAVTDGTDVYRLKTIASVRTDVNAMFPDTVLPQGVERRFGIKSASKMRNGFFEPYGMEVCVISVRKDEGPVIKRTGVMVP